MATEENVRISDFQGDILAAETWAEQNAILGDLEVALAQEVTERAEALYEQYDKIKEGAPSEVKSVVSLVESLGEYIKEMSGGVTVEGLLQGYAVYVHAKDIITSITATLNPLVALVKVPYKSVEYVAFLADITIYQYKIGLLEDVALELQQVKALRWINDPSTADELLPSALEEALGRAGPRVEVLLESLNPTAGPEPIGPGTEVDAGGSGFFGSGGASEFSPFGNGSNAGASEPEGRGELRLPDGMDPGSPNMMKDADPNLPFVIDNTPQIPILVPPIIPGGPQVGIGDLTLIGTYTGPDAGVIRGLAWDGTNIWSVTSPNGFNSTIYKHNMDATLSVQQTIPSPSTYSIDIEWINGSLWSVDNASDRLVNHDATPGTVSATFGMNGRRDPEGLSFDGANILATNEGFLQQFDTSGTFLTEILFLGTNDFDLTVIDGKLVIGNSEDLTVVDAASLQAEEVVTLPSVAVPISVRGLAFDGDHLWVGDTTNNQILQYDIA